MIANSALQLTLTGIFAVAAAYYLVPAVVAKPVTERVDAGWHALAGIAMVVMLWPWGTALPPVAGAVVFGCATVWFAVQALAHRGSRWGNGYHAVMMTSMVAMWVSMARLTGGAAAGPSDAAIAPMAMGVGDMPHRPAWIAQTTLALGVFYLLATGLFTLGLWRSRGARDCGASALMAAGMGAFFLGVV